jgi:hypothetical protein
MPSAVHSAVTLLGDVTWQFSTKADGQGVSVSPVVAVPVGLPAETG